MKLEELTEICGKDKKIVCMVGAGGKTSLIFHIAKDRSAAGKKVLVTTTTHILKPERNFAETADEVRDLWKSGNFAVIGKKTESRKVTFSEELYEELSAEADLILIEADGSKMLPCKIPAAHEPVIVAGCGLVVGVMGMTAVGRPLKEICFRFETEGKWLETTDDEILTPRTAAKILSDERGNRKNTQGLEYIIVLNQCDDQELMGRAEKVKEEIEKISDIPVICTSLRMRK